MNTIEFLKTVLPPEGVYIIAVQTGRGFKHKGFSTVEEAAQCALACDRAGMATYHACASYLQAPYKDESGKFVARTRINWRAAKAFWCDVDCGPDKAAQGKGYATQLDGAKALLQWCKDKGLPYPMLVNSGRGIHAYWCLTGEMQPGPWVQAASMLKVLMQRGGLLVDPSRTSDFASVLRPIGTHNRKDPQNPLAVSLVRAQKEPIEPADFVARLMTLYTQSGDDLPPAPSWLNGAEGDAIPEAYQPVAVDANALADKCAQVRQVRDTQGDASYDHWRGVIGLTTFTEQGIEAARAWSAKRGETGHQNCDVDTRFNTWSSAPPTCEFFQKCNPSGCEGCPFKGKIKTPLVLGRKEPKPVTGEEEVVIENDRDQSSVTVEIPELPSGYEWNGQAMVRYIKNKDGILEAHPFSKTRFYLIDRIRNAEGCFEFVARAHLPKGILREFRIPGDKIGEGGTKLFGILGSFEVYTINTKDAPLHMTSYIKDSVARLMETKSITSTHTAFGWQDGASFLLGTRLYKADGSECEALLSGYASDQRKCFPRPVGTLEGYAKQINWLYNRPGMEPLQYMICSMWASPIVQFAEPLYNGIPVAVTGASSGKGKTTAGIAALYAFGDAKAMTLVGDSGATTKARAAMLGAMQNLPLLFDETTNINPKSLSQLCYALSNGLEAMRLQSSGGRVTFSNREMWRLQAALTGNSYLTARLSQNGNSEAEAMRIFEIRVDNYSIPVLDPMLVSTAVAEMSRNAGSAGVAYIKYLVTHYNEVAERFAKTLERLAGSSEEVREPKYRFYRNHMACTLTAAEIMKDLGVIDFDLDRLQAFAVDNTKTLLEEAKEMTQLEGTNALEKMISDLSPRIFTTPTYETKSNEPPYQIHTMVNGVVGRAIQGTPTRKDTQLDGKLLLSVNAVKDWCLENRVDVGRLAHDLKVKGVLLERRARFTLGKSTNLVTPQTRCWMLDLNQIENGVADDDEGAGAND